MEIRFTTSSRKHRIGRGRALYVIATTDPVLIPAADGLSERLMWIGTDERGLELEIVAIQLDDTWLVVHVMPYRFRRR